MESACLNCVMKHLSQAMIIHEEEVPMGYPRHIYRVLGHLAEASRESVLDYPALGNLLREHRLALIEDRNRRIPYQGLLEYVDLVLHAVDAGIEVPAVPEELHPASLPATEKPSV